MKNGRQDRIAETLTNLYDNERYVPKETGMEMKG